MKNPKWQANERERIQKLTNKELYDEVFDLCVGDDWDGEFTSRGRWTYYRLEEELSNRLSGWLQGGRPWVLPPVDIGLISYNKTVWEWLKEKIRRIRCTLGNYY